MQCDYKVSIYNVNIRATLQPNSSSDFTTTGFYSWENPACCHTSRLHFHDVIVGLVIFRLSRSLVPLMFVVLITSVAYSFSALTWLDFGWVTESVGVKVKARSSSDCLEAHPTVVTIEPKQTCPPCVEASSENSWGCHWCSRGSESWREAWRRSPRGGSRSL